MKRIVSFLAASALALFMAGCNAAEQIEAPEVVVVEDEGALPVRERTGERLSEIQESGILLIGISPDYAPFAFTDEENGGTVYAGSDIELGKYIAQELGVEAAFVENGFEDCLRAAGNKEADIVLLGMVEDTSRRRYVDFTEEYYCPGAQALAVRREDAQAYPTLEELAGKTIAAQYGSLQAQLIAEQLPESYMELTDNAKDGIALLRAGRVDAVALDERMAERFLKEYTDISLSDARFTYEGAKIVGGVAREEPKLLKAVNGIVEEVIEEGLYLEWLDAATEQAASLTKEGRSSRQVSPSASPQEHDPASPAAGSGQ